MFETKDQLGRPVVLQQYPPIRIISLVPSITELLHDLGLEDEVAGITKFCVHPQNWFRSKIRIGGTKNVNIEKARSLQPDLIIANKEENVKEQVETLESISPVYISDINTYEDALEMIETVGVLTGKKEKAAEIIDQIEIAFGQNFKIQGPNSNDSRVTGNWQPATCYLIWRNPYMTTGGDTFISDMLRKCGFENVFANEQRYPKISLEEIAERKPQLVLLSSEPYPFKQRHIEEIRAVMPNAIILLVDGEMFSWYGSRMLYAAQYFLELREKIFQIGYNSNLDFC